MEALGHPADFSARRMHTHFPLTGTHNLTGSFTGSPALALGVEVVRWQGEQFELKGIFPQDSEMAGPTGRNWISQKINHQSGAEIQAGP